MHPKNQPQNKGMFQQVPFETKFKNELDLKFDLYRNIEKIKYMDKYLPEKAVQEKIKEIEQKREKLRQELYKKHGF